MSTIKSAAKVLQVLKAMRGKSLSGVSNQQLSQELDEAPANITRALQTLQQEGFAQQLEDGNYALSNSLLAIAHAHSQEVQRAQSRLSEHCQRVDAATKNITG